jgi:hypothetical protein
MSRTTKALVAGIIEVDSNVIPSDAAMAPFIEVASELVTEWCTGDNGPATAYAVARLELIERWLAAHFYTVRDPRAASEGVSGGPTATYQSAVDRGFDTSHYGQTAMRLDTNGGLTRLNSSILRGGGNVRVVWAGTPYPRVWP